MRIWMKATLVGLMVGSHSMAHAQDSEETKVVRAAAEYVRGQLPKGRIIVANDKPLSANASLSDVAAGVLGAARGSVSGAVRCSDESRRRLCSIVGADVVVAFNTPTLKDGEASVAVGWWTQGTEEKVVTRFVELKLERDRAGRWTVTSTLSQGVS
jgi:hypothetical protein